MNFTYQWGHLSWFVNAWLEQGPTDWCRKARGWATEDHCSRSGRGGGDWTWGWLGELTLLDESCWVWGELPQSWEASLKKWRQLDKYYPYNTLMYKLKGNAHTKPRILMVTVKRCNNYTYLEERHKIRLGWGVELFVQSAGELFSFQFALLIKHNNIMTAECGWLYRLCVQSKTQSRSFYTKNTFRITSKRSLFLFFELYT